MRLLTVFLGALTLSGFAVSEFPDPNAAPIYLDRGAAGLSRCIAELRTRASMLMITAHPDDEDGGMLAMQTRGLGARAALMTLTRGEGGQNAMSNDLYDALGLVRTQELLQADRYYGVEQYWGRAIDYGFSKTREEALEKWGYDRTLSDVVRVIRMVRPLVITSVFVGAPTDGHGNHQVAGQMAQEAWVAAGDPKRFPEQIREGLRPWAPLKVYERVPVFTPTKENTIYDYATDKYVPMRFFDYIHKVWIEGKPSTDVTVPEGSWNAATGLTFQQIGRQGWGFQKSQNGGGTLPPPALVSIAYHRYGSRVAVDGPEKTFYDGIDTSLTGIAGLLKGADAGDLRQGLARISALLDEVQAKYRPDNPSLIAPLLAEGLKQIRNLESEIRDSPSTNGRLARVSDGDSPSSWQDVEFELGRKEKQFEQALLLALGVTLEANVAPEKPPTGPFAASAGPAATLTTVVPGQMLFVQASLLHRAARDLSVEQLQLASTDGKSWTVKPEAAVQPVVAPGTDFRLRYRVQVPEDAPVTRAYFSRPNEEQPYYDLTDERYRNLSLAPYPLQATAKLVYDGAAIEVQKVVQTNSRTEGIGMLQNPLYVAPALSLTVSPAAGAMPLGAKAFNFSCALQSNVKNAQGRVRLELPNGWRAEPTELPFEIAREGQTETLDFVIHPQAVEQKTYELKAVADLGRQHYQEGYRLVGYAGLRPYPYYRPATYHVAVVDVKVAPGIRVGFLPGTGDDVPRALGDLNVPVRVLTAADVESGNFAGLDAIVLGVRAYQVRPELRAANNRLLNYVKNGGVLIVQYNLQNFDESYTPYPLSLGNNPEKVVDEFSAIRFINPKAPALSWPNKLTPSDFGEWQEERGHGFAKKWDTRYDAPLETHDPGQEPQAGGLLIARYGKGIYVYNAYALYRQLPAGVPGAYRILANLVSLGKNPANPVPRG